MFDFENFRRQYFWDKYNFLSYIFRIIFYQQSCKCELFEHLNSVIRLREHEAKEMAWTLIIALSELHKRNIIHRDIKLVSLILYPK